MTATKPRRPVVVMKGAGSEASRLTAELYEGDGLALCGVDEANRSLTLAWITGEHEPNVGSVRVLGARAGGPEARSVLSSVTPRLTLGPNLTVEETLYIFGKFSGAASSGRSADELLLRFELERQRHRLVGSLDEQTRGLVVVMAGLIRPSKVLCLDRPECMVTETQASALVEVLAERMRSGAVLVLSTRDRIFLPVISRMFSFSSQGVRAVGRPERALL